MSHSTACYQVGKLKTQVQLNGYQPGADSSSEELICDCIPTKLPRDWVQVLNMLATDQDAADAVSIVCKVVPLT